MAQARVGCAATFGLLAGVLLGASIDLSFGSRRDAQERQGKITSDILQSAWTVFARFQKLNEPEWRCALRSARLFSCPTANTETAPGLTSLPASHPSVTTATYAKPVPIFGTREDLPGLLEAEGFTRGAQLGAQRGHYAATVLSGWPSAEHYLLADLWNANATLGNNPDASQAAQHADYADALERTAPWADKVNICRNFSIACAWTYEDNFFDWVYLDAHFDGRGTHFDIVEWWPKLRSGGLMCGHDFVSQTEGPDQQGLRCDISSMDGSLDPTGACVKGAVLHWAKAQQRQVQLSYKENGWWTWCIRK